MGCAHLGPERDALGALWYVMSTRLWVRRIALRCNIITPGLGGACFGAFLERGPFRFLHVEEGARTVFLFKIFTVNGGSANFCVLVDDNHFNSPQILTPLFSLVPSPSFSFPPSLSSPPHHEGCLEPDLNLLFELSLLVVAVVPHLSLLDQQDCA